MRFQGTPDNTRLLVRGHGIRVFDSSEARLDLYGYTGLEVIVQLARSP